MKAKLPRKSFSWIVLLFCFYLLQCFHAPEATQTDYSFSVYELDHAWLAGASDNNIVLQTLSPLLPYKQDNAIELTVRKLLAMT